MYVCGWRGLLSSTPHSSSSIIIITTRFRATASYASSSPSSSSSSSSSSPTPGWRGSTHSRTNAGNKVRLKLTLYQRRWIMFFSFSFLLFCFCCLFHLVGWRRQNEEEDVMGVFFSITAISIIPVNRVFNLIQVVTRFN